MLQLFVTLSVLGLISCSKSSRQMAEPFPNFLSEDVEFITYEGILPTENGQELLAVLQLVPGTPGMDSYYRLEESLAIAGWPWPASMSMRSHGTYSVLLETSGRHILQLSNRSLISSLMLGKGFSRGDRVTEDLFLKSNGDHELVFVNKDFVEANERYKLIRRSDLFTVEGYFSVYDDTTDYFEKNTQKTWPVAQLACYDEAVKNYHAMAKVKFEGIYLKALSYTVKHRDANGKERDVLVFKRILQMSAAKDI